MKIFYIPMILLGFILGGCGFTSQGTLIEELFRSNAAKAYDGGIDNALQFVCNDASVGSIIRKFMVTKEKAEAWMELCFTDRDALQNAVLDKINADVERKPVGNE